MGGFPKLYGNYGDRNPTQNARQRMSPKTDGKQKKKKKTPREGADANDEEHNKGR